MGHWVWKDSVGVEDLDDEHLAHKVMAEKFLHDHFDHVEKIVPGTGYALSKGIWAPTAPKTGSSWGYDYGLPNQFAKGAWITAEMSEPWIFAAGLSKTPGDELAEVLPGLNEKAECPACEIKNENMAYTVSVIVQHLNDYHLWSREKIADWLDGLDVDLTFPIPDEIKEETLAVSH